MSWLSYWKPSLTVLLVLFKVKKVSSWDVISHTWPSYLVTLHPRGICWYRFVSPTRLLKYTHPSRRAVLMMPVSLPLSVCFLCVSWLSLSPCLYLSRRGAKFLPVRPVKQHSWNSSTQQGSAARLIVWCQVVHSSYVVQSCCCLAFLELSLTSELSSLLGLRFSSSTCQFANWQVDELCPAFHFPFSLSKDRPSHSLLHSTPTGHRCSPLPSEATALCSILCQPATLMHSPSSGWWGSGAQIQIRAMFAKLQRPCFPVMLRAFGLCFWFSFHSSVFLDSSVDIYC